MMTTPRDDKGNRYACFLVLQYMGQGTVSHLLILLKDQVSRIISSANFLVEIFFSLLDTPPQADQHVLLAKHREGDHPQAEARAQGAQH